VPIALNSSVDQRFTFLLLGQIGLDEKPVKRRG
jgi:hypothetical protein